ncbi:GNAT family N-acetyltransferase [Facklamia sp. DSM 111018]|uniref:GNAT family N-acetyltransferase n=1 Tax=Facklamia lactis TaxID=2749967 RepID=A0ABS0LQB2_9LACT|nr:GNAT family N-acetyltransferase [Facklamia lactis]MBG9986187.1 GNAT family N-acetyltransferase [Facklamia lactis]
MEIVNLNNEQIEELENRLEEYDKDYIPDQLDGSISIGIEENGKIIAGLDATMTTFKIMYLSTIFVDAADRKKGYGKILMEELERRSKQLGANTIRLDTFSWQGKEFYEALGYQQVGYYHNEEDQYEEYFFLKRL